MGGSTQIQKKSALFLIFSRKYKPKSITFEEHFFQLFPELLPVFFILNVSFKWPALKGQAIPLTWLTG